MNATTHDYHGFCATVIADSIPEGGGPRLTSLLVTFPRFILAEMNTHRAFSRNSASSRAIPFDRMLASVKEHPFVPVRFLKEHKGMQGTEYYEGPSHELRKALWLQSSEVAIACAQAMHNMGVTKQLCNRLLEPFLWHTVLITATDWANFFNLRAFSDKPDSDGFYHSTGFAAEIHMQEIAGRMLEAIKNSTPQVLTEEDYHAPFITGGVAQSLQELQVSVARCARTSYLNFNGTDSIDADVKLYDRLRSQGHMSPFEHVARPFCDEDGFDDRFAYCGNFRGWAQVRKEIRDENRTDPRFDDGRYK